MTREAKTSPGPEAEIRLACGTDLADAEAALDHLIQTKNSQAIATVYRQAAIEYVRAHAVDGMSLVATDDERSAFFSDLLKREYSPTIRVQAIRTFSAFLPDEALAAAIEMLRPGPDPSIRAEAATLLADLASTLPDLDAEQVAELYEAFVWVWERAVTGPLSFFLSKKSNSEQKLASLLGCLKRSDWLVRESFDADCAAISLGGGADSAATQALAETIIRRVHQEEWSDRATSLVAVLLISILRSRDQCAVVLNQLAHRERMSDTALQGLRLELGGRIALKPILDVAYNEFAEPLKELRTKTMMDWEKATSSAQVGFVLRVAMSAIVFVVGLLVTCVSTYRVLFAGAGEQLLGPGVSLAAGLAAMLSVVYTGPLSDVKKSVTDLADTDIAFITFMHRLQFTAGLIQSEYAHGKMSQQSIAAAGKRLSEGLDDWSKLIHRQSASKEDTDAA